MQQWALMVHCLAAVTCALALKENDLEPVNWVGGVTLMHPGKKVNNGLATRAQIFKDNVFICVPRFKPGIEATLLKTCMKSKDHDGNVCLEPFPNWKEQTEGDCSCLQSAIDLFLDPTGLLWVLDAGTAQTNEPQTVQKCPPKIVAYDVRNGKIIKEIILSAFISPESRLQFIVADYAAEGSCFIYVSDAGTKSIIVYNVNAEKGHRVVLPPEVLPDSVPKDVLYMLLIRKSSGENFVYFTYRSGEDVFAVNSRSLQFENAPVKSFNVGKKQKKLIFLGTDDWDCIYFRYENKTEVYKWNTAKPFSEANFQLVDNVKSELIPTHAMTDYSRGVMRLIKSNLPHYINSGTKQEEAINSLVVMQLN
nr:protein yellow-like [Halyomorpha halys]